MTQFSSDAGQQFPPMSDPAAKVKPPAIAIIIAISIGMVLGLVGLLFNVLGISIGASQGGEEGMINMVSGGVGIAQAVVGLAIGTVIIIGSKKMMELESYGFAMSASILAMIPCVSPCCLLGLPFGIWAIVVLCQEDVKAAFKA